MSVAVTKDHAALSEVADSFLSAQQARKLARRSLDDAAVDLTALTGAMGDLGWFGLHVQESYGGGGFGLPELVVVLEQLGRFVAPGPFLPTVLTSALVEREGGEVLRGALLPLLATGEAFAGIGLAGNLTISPAGPTVSVTGDAGPVMCATGADYLLIRSGEDVVVIDARAEGVTISATDCLDLTRRSDHVVLNGVPIAATNLLSGATRTLTRLARVLFSAEAAGGALACVEDATAYAKFREQFGRPIGTFQAVKHRLADMFAAAQASTVAVWQAAQDSGDNFEADFAAAVAATKAMPGYQFAARSNLQLHGGIGFTWEHDAHLYLRRAATLAALLEDLGSPAVELLKLRRDGTRTRAHIELPREAESYREQARAFVDAYESSDPWTRRKTLVESGYCVPHWPKPWGRQAGAVEQLVIDEVFSGRVDVPDLGITGWVILTIAQHGTESQRHRWVRPALLGELTWAQMFSEPSAGSDAAAISTRAKATTGGWLVNGQKVWTSGAQSSEWGFATVRTDASGTKHQGVTMMAINLKAPGVQVIPLREITGHALFNEVFLDEVFVPDDDVVGPVGDGWRVARATLGNERVSIGAAPPPFEFQLDDLVAAVNPAEADAVHADKVGQLIADATVLQLLNVRSALRAVGGGEPGPEGNLTKLLAAEYNQRLTEVALDALGSDAVTTSSSAAMGYLFSRCLTIAGGTSEITRNQIAERILGLPRDPLLR